MATKRAAIACILLSASALGACGPSDSPAARVHASGSPLRKPMPASELDAYRGCERDDDCVWVTNGCCDCANGGVEIAIAGAQKTAFQSRFDCGNLPCTSRGRETECGTGRVACENALCVFHARTESP